MRVRPKVRCLRCRYEGDEVKFTCCMSPYHDFNCPVCGTTEIDTPEVKEVPEETSSKNTRNDLRSVNLFLDEAGCLHVSEVGTGKIVGYVSMVDTSGRTSVLTLKNLETGDLTCHECGVAVIRGTFCCRCGAPNGV